MKKTRVSLLWVLEVVLIIVLLISIGGCETLKRLNKIGPEPVNIKYIPAVPDNVTFVVLPFNDYMPQLEYAASVEKAMIQTGLHVVAPPHGIMEVEERKGAGIAQDGGALDSLDKAAQRTESQSLRIERYKVVEDTKADYYIETMLLTSVDGTVKFTRKSDRKIIGVFTLSGYPYYDLEEEMIQQLVKMQFLKEDKNTTQIHGTP